MGALEKSKAQASQERSWDGFSTKTHIAVDGLGNPIEIGGSPVLSTGVAFFATTVYHSLDSLFVSATLSLESQRISTAGAKLA